MDKFVIQGGKLLEGTVTVSGAKNAVLPAMAATILSNGIHVIKNVPDLRDVTTMSKLLRMLGASVVFENSVLTIDTSHIDNYEAPYELVKTMRASVYVLGPLLARFGKARVSLPGGCAWGPRPIDLHLSGFRKLGVDLTLDTGYINANVKVLQGNEIRFPTSSVGATGNILMGSVLAVGETVICNAAQEPEITALVDNLNSMGAQIDGSGTDTLRITGVSSLNPLHSVVIPDRIEAGTFLIACALAGGSVTLDNAEPAHMTAVTDALKEAGAHIETAESLKIKSDGDINPVTIRTAIYPGFPTDMQAQWIALMTIAKGNSIVEDTIFYDRFTHVSELNRLGAHINVDMNKAHITGVKTLKGAQVMSTDLRASASLILAGLRAGGRTEVQRIYHIDRGYESIEHKLHELGADIKRMPG